MNASDKKDRKKNEKEMKKKTNSQITLNEIVKNSLCSILTADMIHRYEYIQVSKRNAVGFWV